MKPPIKPTGLVFVNPPTQNVSQHQQQQRQEVQCLQISHRCDDGY